MAVLAFKDVQSQVKTLLAARAYFAGETIVEHRGRALAEVETALNERGQAVVVLPVQNGGSPGNGYRAAKLTVTIAVLFLFNPEKGTKDIYEMVTEGIGAILDYFNPNTPNDRYEIETLDIGEADEGVWGYVATFSKAVQFKT